MAERQRQILIVEDDAELCDLLAQAVKDITSNYEVRTASNVDEAMVQVRRFQTLQKAFDLVITDIKMAGLSGLELLEVLNSISPQTRTIVMTAYNSAELAERAQALNVYAYLTKPFIISEFRQLIQQAISPEQASAAADAPAAGLALSGAQTHAVQQQLSALRQTAGINAALLIDRAGKLVAADAQEAEVRLDNLGEALLIAQRHVEQQINAALDTQASIEQSYFGTKSLSICIYRITDDYFAGAIFGPAVRESQVWYYMRDAAPGIKAALNATERAESPAESRRSLKDEYMAMVDQYFSGDARRRRQREQPETGPQEPEQPVEPAPKSRRGKGSERRPAAARTPATRRDSTDETLEAPPPSAPVIEPLLPDPLTNVEVQEADLEAIQGIDWSLDADMDWGELVSETDQGFRGMTLEEAQQQGVDLGQVVPVEQAGAPAVLNEQEEAALEEIDWNLDVKTDWDALVSETDQGIEGIGIEEAKKQGLLGDLPV